MIKIACPYCGNTVKIDTGKELVDASNLTDRHAALLQSKNETCVTCGMIVLLKVEMVEKPIYEIQTSYRVPLYNREGGLIAASTPISDKSKIPDKIVWRETEKTTTDEVKTGKVKQKS